MCKIMEKKNYIQPKLETMVLPKEALMDDLVLAGSGSMGTVGGSNAAPKLVPKLGNDSVQVF